MLTAATGVGAGDLATGSFAGSLLGTAILWAVIVGAFLKYVVTEGIARWQLATGTTLLEGLTTHLGRGTAWLFPIFDDPVNGKIFFGILASITGFILVFKGGYQLFEKIIHVCIVIMFICVILTAGLMWPGTELVMKGLFIPSIPDIQGDGITWKLWLLDTGRRPY
jgi:Mn2+/Fe2+ NRAMP family transporter